MRGWRAAIEIRAIGLCTAEPTTHRFSPLKEISEQTITELGLMWSRELGTTRGPEATPLVENGVIYTTGSWSVVYAPDAKTGDVRWTYDAAVPRARAGNEHF